VRRLVDELLERGAVEELHFAALHADSPSPWKRENRRLTRAR